MLSKDDVIASIKDYPVAQKILEKYGRKRLALGTKYCEGPRNENTSSDTETEDEVKYKNDRASESCFTCVNPKANKTETVQDYGKTTHCKNNALKKNEPNMALLIKVNPNSYNVICFETARSLIQSLKLSNVEVNMAGFSSQPNIIVKNIHAKKNLRKKQNASYRRSFKKSYEPLISKSRSNVFLHARKKQSLLARKRFYSDSKHFGHLKQKKYNNICKTIQQEPKSGLFKKGKKKFFSNVTLLAQVKGITSSYNFKVREYVPEKNDGKQIIGSILGLCKLKADLGSKKVIGI